MQICSLLHLSLHHALISAPYFRPLRYNERHWSSINHHVDLGSLRLLLLIHNATLCGLSARELMGFFSLWSKEDGRRLRQRKETTTSITSLFSSHLRFLHYMVVIKCCYEIWDMRAKCELFGVNRYVIYNIYGVSCCCAIEYANSAFIQQDRQRFVSQH